MMAEVCISANVVIDSGHMLSVDPMMMIGCSTLAEYSNLHCSLLSS